MKPKASMTRIALSAVTASLLAVGLNSAAQAAPNRVFVAAQGSDANACTFAAPCRTFQHAHDVVAANGEIDVLEPAGYGAVIIIKAISIQGHGFSGITTPSGGTGITINAGSGDKINLRGLIIEGAGTGQYGIVFNTGNSLTITDCVVRNLTLGGIVLQPLAGSASPSRFAIADTLISDIGQDGIEVVAGTGGFSTTAHATFTRVQVSHALGAGILAANFASAPSQVSITDSVTQAGNTGLSVGTFSGGPVTVMVVRSVVANNNVGVSADGMVATVRLSSSVVTGNTTALSTSNGATLTSYADNQIDGNGG